jgi:hypothetical protein
VPLQPPDALQEVAFVELQVNVDALPLLTAICDALMDALGSAPTGEVLTAFPQPANSAAAMATSGVKYRITSPVFFNRKSSAMHLLVNLPEFHYVNRGNSLKRHRKAGVSHAITRRNMVSTTSI